MPRRLLAGDRINDSRQVGHCQQPLQGVIVGSTENWNVTAPLIEGPLRYYLQVLHGDYYFPGNYELGDHSYGAAVFAVRGAVV